MFSDAEREIFTFFDGTRDRRADPMVAYRKLVTAETDDGKRLDEVLGVVAARTGDDSPEYYRALEQSIGLIRSAFGVPSFDDGGLTERETMALLGSFNDFQDRLKKDSAPTPDGSPSTDGPPAGSASGPILPPAPPEG